MTDRMLCPILYIYVSVCVCVYVCMYVGVCVCVCDTVCVCDSICLVYQPVYLVTVALSTRIMYQFV